MRTATRRATENLVQLALDEAVDAVLIAGDVYDGDWRGYNTGLFFQRQLGRLEEADIPVYLVSGNHDAQSQISKTLTLPRNVHVFTTHQPETVHDQKLGIAVHGQGYVTRAVTDNLASNFPQRASGFFNIGLLHTALDGRSNEHKPYAPCSPSQLAALGYDYWALGHVHTRETVSTEPHIVFPGNIQGRHAREIGPKGCTLVTVSADGVRDEHRDLDLVRWNHLRIDISAADDLDDVCTIAKRSLEAARDDAGERLLAVRVTLVGRSAAHMQVWREHERLTHEIRSIALDVGDLWIEKVRSETQPTAADDTADAGDTADLVAGLLRTAHELGEDADQLRALIEKDRLWSRLPREAHDVDVIGEGEPQWRGRLLDEARDLLVSMVQEGAR